MSYKDIKSYLFQRPPSVISTPLNEKDGVIAWGEVKKGKEEEATENKIFLLDKFLKTIEEGLV